jgi:hypothetical protein
MTLTHPNRGYTSICLLPDSKRRYGPATALETRETHALTAPTAGRRERGQAPPQIDGGLLEHLRAHLAAPGQSGRYHLDSAVRVGDQHPTGVGRPLPFVEQVDQVKP